MALLRSSARHWSRALRFYCAEPLLEAVDPTQFAKFKHARIGPIDAIKNENFAIVQHLTDKIAIKNEDWRAARREILSTEKLKISEATVDMLMVNLCLEMKNPDSAMAYLEYLWDGDKEMNLLPMTTYLRLCYAKEDGELGDKEKKYLIDIYETVRRKYPIFDALTGESCILGISKTARWKDSFEILDMIKVTCTPKRAAYSAVISAAFDNDEPEIGWKYLNETASNFLFENGVYMAYLRYCERHFEGDRLIDEIGKLFKFWGDFDIRPHVDVIEAFEKVFKNLGWRTERTSIREIGICRSCSSRLQNFKISDAEFDKLTQFIYDRVIVGDDIYKKTTPKELNHFLRFVHQNKPWDIVIDGLNVAYLTKASSKMNGHLVKTTVTLCCEMGKKVLVLGRKHMERWPNLDISYIRQKANIFLADNGSADDPYLLYATLVSGPDTKFVSRDLMRQHKFLLEDPTMTRIFKNWQITHQFLPEAVRSRSGKLEMRLISPPKYLPVVQRDENGWHVPFTFDPSPQPPLDYEPPKSWVCFRRNQSCTSTARSSGT